MHLVLSARVLRHCALGCLAASACFGVRAVAGGDEHWPQWRGPGFSGVAPAGDYPLLWTADKNVKWKVVLPGAGASTPAVWGDKIFLTAAEKGRNLVLAYDRAGRQLWNVDAGEERQGKHAKATGSNPSPSTDGKTLFAYFKSGDLLALSLQGEVLWRKNLQDEFGADTLWWDLGTSPVMVDDLLVVACMQSEPSPSYLVAFDKATGRQVWKKDRELNAPEEAAQSYTTPLVAKGESGESVLVVLGADHVTAHRAADGEELWRVGGLNPEGNRFFRSIASPVLLGDVVIAPYARGSSLTAIRLGGRGDVTKSHVLWRLEGEFTDVPTPAAAGNRVYVCQDKKKNSVVCLDAKTGAAVWQAELPRARDNYSASPILAGDKLFVTREDGATFVLNAENGELLGESTVDEFTVATPVLLDDQILIRTKTSLYCIGK